MKAKQFMEEVLSVKISANSGAFLETGLKNTSLNVCIDSGAWTLSFDAGGNVAFSSASTAASLGTKIEMSDATFEKMIAGDLNIPFAYMMRKIKVSGDLDVAVKFGLCLKKML